MNVKDIAKTLEERGQKYGSFLCHAKISQDLKAVMQRTPGWVRLAEHQEEALEMIVHKIARILNGDPHFHDSWHDIAGYAQLVANSLVEASEEGKK